MLTCIRGAALYDPSTGLNGQIQDLWLEGDHIISAPEKPDNFRLIDGRSLVIAPGGVEIHTHVAGASLRAARAFFLDQPELQSLLLPDPDEAARRYLRMGYTTVMDAAMAPLLAWQTHRDLAAMAGINRGTYTLLGDHRLVHAAASRKDTRELIDTIAWLLEATGGYGVKLVNPGAGLRWKVGQPPPRLDDELDSSGLTQRGFILAVIEAVEGMQLPHPVHLHAGSLGIPGNWTSFRDTANALEGHRAHLSHAQFYCYGKDSRGRLSSAASQVAYTLARLPELTMDVGQVIFGEALGVTADLAAMGYLCGQTGSARTSRYLEGEGGWSLMPLTYLQEDAAAAVQWAAGLELFLNSPDPGRVFLTCDHPNGGPFTAYPQIIQWLVNREARMDVLMRIHRDGRDKSGLAGLQREYTMAEVIDMTSCGPAHALGLLDRGSLAPDCRADLRAYHASQPLESMFSSPEWVMVAGEMVVLNHGETLSLPEGDTLCVIPPWDRDRKDALLTELGELLSFDPSQYALQPWIDSFPLKVVPCIKHRP